MALTKVTYSMIDGAPNNVLDYGADPTGAADSTTAIQNAIDAGDSVYFPAGTYIFSNSTFTKSIKIIGESPASTKILWKANSAESSLFKFNTNRVDVEFYNVTIDGNKANQTDSTGYYAAIDSSEIGGSTLFCDNVWFINGRILDIRAYGPLTASPIFLTVNNCKFTDGLIGDAIRAAQCIASSESVIAEITNNYFSLSAKPASYGRAGFVLQRPAGSTNVYYGKVIGTGNTFKNIGRGTASTLGCLDVYSGADELVLSNNLFDTPIGRAVSAKADSGSIKIENNSVIGFDPLVASQAAIVLFNQADSYTSNIQRSAIIANNSVRNNARNDGFSIFVDGRNSAGVQSFENVVVANNSLDGQCLASINVRFVGKCLIEGNNITGGATVGIRYAEITDEIVVQNNYISDCNVAGVSSLASCTACNAIILNNTIINTTTHAINLVKHKSYIVKNNIVDTAQFFLTTVGSDEFSAVCENTTKNCSAILNKSGTDVALWYENNQTTTAVASSTRTATIASGVITVFADWQFVDTEGGAATDDLDTINGGYDGRRLVLFTANSGRDVTLKDNTGNLKLAGDFTLSDAEDSIELIFRSSNWYELSRSDNV